MTGYKEVTINLSNRVMRGLKAYKKIKIKELKAKKVYGILGKEEKQRVIDKYRNDLGFLIGELLSEILVKKIKPDVVGMDLDDLMDDGLSAAGSGCNDATAEV